MYLTVVLLAYLSLEFGCFMDCIVQTERTIFVSALCLKPEFVDTSID